MSACWLLGAARCHWRIQLLHKPLPRLRFPASASLSQHCVCVRECVYVPPLGVAWSPRPDPCAQRDEGGARGHCFCGLSIHWSVPVGGGPISGRCVSSAPPCYLSRVPPSALSVWEHMLRRQAVSSLPLSLSHDPVSELVMLLPNHIKVRISGLKMLEDGYILYKNTQRVQMFYCQSLSMYTCG